MFPVIPVVLATGLGIAFVRARKKKMTPERKKIFENALNTMKDADKLNKLADAFQKDGMRAEANELRKRAKVVSMPAAKKEEYRQAYKAGMKATDPSKVSNLAKAFHSQGFYGSAKNLRDYADGLINSMKANLPHPSEPIGSSEASMPPAAHGLEGNYGNDTGVQEIETDAVEIAESAG